LISKCYEGYKMLKQELSDEPIQKKPLRLWPGVIIAILQLLIRFGVPIIWPEAVMLFIFGGMAGTLLVIVWWAFFSRAQGSERWGAVVLMIVVAIATRPLLHKSMRLMPFVAYIIPVLSLAFVAWAVASRRLSNRMRRATMVATILLACGVWAILQSGGVTGGEFQSDFSWRWSETPEERMLAQTGDESMTLPSALALVESGSIWPGFRGADRDGIIRGVQIETDWSVSPPVEMWRRPVGPGWSSFAVYGDFFYTQEQRGEDEVVSCYSLITGKPVWRHQDATRFWESNSGAGPRGTPTLSEGRIYALGATGILNVLNASDNTKMPTWGFSGSPLVVDDVVIVALAGSLMAYDLSTGESRWTNTAGGDCYSSPHLMHMDGVAQILLQNETGTSSVAPADGALL
jgi:outer membrane protein assembly factor BamB